LNIYSKPCSDVGFILGLLANHSHIDYDLEVEREGCLMANIRELPIEQIRRPLPRQNDPQKVAVLMESIQTVGLQEPIDVLEIEGQYYGFSGCHRYEACTRLGHQTIRCRVRRATPQVLRTHLA
jgi:sulfiredoxin